MTVDNCLISKTRFQQNVVFILLPCNPVTYSKFLTSMRLCISDILRIFIIQPNFLTEKRNGAFLCLENNNAQHISRPVTFFSVSDKDVSQH